jgi:hypothetical protein
VTQISGAADDGIQAMLDAEAHRKERTRQRHARESAALAGGVTGVSRESVRKAKKLNRIDPELAARVRNGLITLDAAYRLVVNDTRVPLFLKLPADVDTELREAADDLELTRQRLVADLITYYLIARRAGRNGWVL